MPEEHVHLRAVIRALAEKSIAPLAADVDERSRFPQEAFDALNDSGFNAVHVPEAYGGQGADAAATCVVIEEVARVDASASLIPAVNKLGTRRRRLHHGLSGGTNDARRQNHSDLRRHQPNSTGRHEPRSLAMTGARNTNNGRLRSRSPTNGLRQCCSSTMSALSPALPVQDVQFTSPDPRRSANFGIRTASRA